MDEQQLLRHRLLDEGVIRSDSAKMTPLVGGISSEIYRVVDGEQTFVVKRALKQLRVEQPWFANTARNQYEQAFLRYVAGFRPDAVPRLIFSNPTVDYFCMEYLSGFSNWKEDLLAAPCDENLCHANLSDSAGTLLAQIHAHSWGDPAAERDFDTTENFEQLRIDPYLRATAAKNPALAEPILLEADRLRQSRKCLVHGDFSPKNLLHREGRLVVLDCEVAWYGDPAFDMAFFLNHLCLKALYHLPKRPPLAMFVEAAWEAYQKTNPHALQIEAHTSRLLPMLLLARVDGKSPVEYLTDDGKLRCIREFASAQILRASPLDLSSLLEDWFTHIHRLQP